MKILFITDLYPIQENEQNTPLTLYNFVKVWKNRGIHTDVLRPNFMLNSFLRHKPFYKTGFYNGIYNLNYWTPFMFNVLQKAHLTENYDIAVAHMPSGILFAEKTGLPYVAGIHNSDLKVLTSPLYSLYFRNRLKNAVRNAKAVACRSEVIKSKLLNILPDLKDRVFTAPSGVDEKFITKRVFSQKPDTLKIVTCANLIKRKNIDKVIKACQEIENIELTVIGDGVQKNRLQKIDKNVVFTGKIPNEKVLEIMRNNDVFILPSVEETFGMVYLEAMASGCITVCAENDGVAGIIKNKVNGFCVKPEKEEIKKLILNIKNIDENDIKNLINNTYETICRYTQTKCANEYLQHLIKIL